MDEQDRRQPGAIATIGQSIFIKGEISGNEDLLIEGRAEGTINLGENQVTVSESGKVDAHINGRLIHVDGQVTGDLTGGEQVVIHRTGRVQGNITAPRVSLEDGARLKGLIDTDVDAPPQKEAVPQIEEEEEDEEEFEATQEEQESYSDEDEDEDEDEELLDDDEELDEESDSYQ